MIRIARLDSGRGTWAHVVWDLALVGDLATTGDHWSAAMRAAWRAERAVTRRAGRAHSVAHLCEFS